MELVADGKMVPCLILDTTGRPDFEQFVAAHQHTPPGDVDTTWVVRKKSPRSINLLFEFRKPSVLVVRLEFGIVELGGIVDQIMAAKLVYLQPGRPGDVLDFDDPKPQLIVEVMAQPFERQWDDMLLLKLTKLYQKRGLSKKRAQKAASDMVANWRAFVGSSGRDN